MMRKREIDDDKLIVITGAAGFIGSGVVRYLNDKGYKNLVIVDGLGETTKWKNLTCKQFAEWIHPEELFEWLKGRERDIEAFIHLGACSDTMETDGDYLLKNNYEYSVRLAEYALEYDIRFIYASSAATYGAGDLGFNDDHDLIPQLKPLNMYGFSKQLFDQWALNQGVIEDVVGLKYFNVFGPNENEKGRMASMIFKAVPFVQKEGVIRLFKSTEPGRFVDGGQCRDFIYVKDAARMTCSFLKNDAGGIYNIGQGRATTWNEVASALFLALELPCSIEYIEMPDELKGQYQNYTCAVMNKFASLQSPGSLCHYSIEDAVIDYVRNYLLKDKRW